MCFSCKESWESGHRCLGKEKRNFTEVPFEGDSESEVSSTKKINDEMKFGSEV